MTPHEATPRPVTPGDPPPQPPGQTPPLPTPGPPPGDAPPALEAFAQADPERVVEALLRQAFEVETP
ncbi:hypothetical protein [Tahibacter soli]|uniref:Uncharacterized protein n=1 Tax=Tahibacter soli TaxID=2983605 RepID=A0A9X4BKP7_9GAMM|nr:hypothetical protein [Tahibacter soli]MDC8014487.1 hypothetical protein [Tahibacter soli]